MCVWGSNTRYLDFLPSALPTELTCLHISMHTKYQSISLSWYRGFHYTAEQVLQLLIFSFAKYYMCISIFICKILYLIYFMPFYVLLCSLLDSIMFCLNTFGILHFTSLPYLTNSYHVGEHIS